MEERFERGIEEFNSQYFFEAHDTWEELWMETTGEHRLFYQGLIQTAVGFYHLSNENYKGACSQFGKALAKLERYLPEFHGIRTRHLVEQVRVCLDDAEGLKSGGVAPFDERKIPRIEWINAGERT
jgi:predicted metal-dependent hydrolase